MSFSYTKKTYKPKFDMANMFEKLRILKKKENSTNEVLKFFESIKAILHLPNDFEGDPLEVIEDREEERKQLLSALRTTEHQLNEINKAIKLVLVKTR